LSRISKLQTFKVIYGLSGYVTEQPERDIVEAVFECCKRVKCELLLDAEDETGDLGAIVSSLVDQRSTVASTSSSLAHPSLASSTLVVGVTNPGPTVNICRDMKARNNGVRGTVCVCVHC
jgi:hypothetical protein